MEFNSQHNVEAFKEYIQQTNEELMAAKNEYGIK